MTLFLFKCNFGSCDPNPSGSSGSMSSSGASGSISSSGSSGMQEKQRRILEAAVQIFAEKGFYPATMGEIAERSGVAKGTVYLYYKSKKELYYEMIRWVFEQMMSQIEQSKHSGRTSWERLAHIYLENLRAVANYRELHDTLLQDWSKLNLDDRQWMKWVQEGSRRWLAPFIEVIEAGIAAGELQAVNPYYAAQVLRGSVMAYLHALATAEEVPSSLEEWAKETLGLLARGLMKEK